MNEMARVKLATLYEALERDGVEAADLVRLNLELMLLDTLLDISESLATIASYVDSPKDGGLR